MAKPTLDELRTAQRWIEANPIAGGEAALYAIRKLMGEYNSRRMGPSALNGVLVDGRLPTLRELAGGVNIEDVGPTPLLIRNVRLREGLTQAEAAKLLCRVGFKTSLGTWASWERAERHMSIVKWRAFIRAILKTCVEDLEA